MRWAWPGDGRRREKYEEGGDEVRGCLWTKGKEDEAAKKGRMETEIEIEARSFDSITTRENVFEPSFPTSVTFGWSATRRVQSHEVESHLFPNLHSSRPFG